MTIVYFFLSGLAISLQRRNLQFISQKAMKKILFFLCIHTVIFAIFWFVGFRLRLS